MHLLIKTISKISIKFPYFIVRHINSNIPKEPVSISIDNSKLPEHTKINQETVNHLERLSLVDFGNKHGIQILEDAIKFADQIHIINTDKVEPLYTVLEKRYLKLREDIVNDGNKQSEILSNASLTEEDYFVAPPGNVPLTPRTNFIK